MLDAWIIEDILGRRQEERQVDRPYLELPQLPYVEPGERLKEEAEEVERGVVIIDYSV